MVPAETLRALAGKLRAPLDFEAGSLALLSALHESLAPALEDRGALIARGSVHLRSEAEGYRALVKREWAGEPTAVAPSASVWGVLVARDAGVAIDLGTGRGITIGDGAELELTLAPVAHDGASSVQQMLAREATHVIALPLRSGIALVGMVCIELAWPLQLGLPLSPEPFLDDAETLSLVAGPLLVGLPLSEPEPADDEIDPLFPVVGASTRPLMRMLERFVAQNETLLITGPTGAGKSRLAEWCHARSKRSKGPFETANLLAVPEGMQMAELFGWRRGAFTGALADHDGLVATADGGTLFLDEIDKLTLAAQAGLLRLLETRRFSPIGVSRERTVDVRFIVATNADLRALVASGSFREDLYYRVNVLPVRLDPLSQRMDEVPAWANVMLARRHREAGGSGDAAFTSAAIAALTGFKWPGNLRQLDNVVRRAFALELATTDADDSPLRVDLEAVRRSLDLEGTFAPGASMPGTGELLRSIGSNLVERAIELRRSGATLSLDALDVLRGAALREAVERLGNVKDAYLLFGADALVESRNHHAAYRRELAALDALEKTVPGKK
jgi:DNA-binding NtrC family response regulator